jgi:N-acetylmuramoyl-L-alanine amidase
MAVTRHHRAKRTLRPAPRRPLDVFSSVWIAFTVVLAASLVVAFTVLAPSPAAARSTGFPDVGKSHVGYDAIKFLSEAGVISGYASGKFGPDDTLKRGQAIKILVRWQGVPTSTATCPFQDLDDTYRAYVRTAYAKGWVAGFGDNAFQPYAPLTREQMAIVMVRAMGWEDEAESLSSAEVSSTLAGFSDRDQISAHARPYLAIAIKKGLFLGSTDGRLTPQSGITRAQFCLVVVRAELSTRAVIGDVRSSSGYGDKTRVVLDLSRAPGEVKAAITAEGMLTVDYEGGAIAGDPSWKVGSAEVASVSARQLGYDPRTVRVTLDLGRYQTFRVMSLGPSGDQGYRLVVDVYRRTDGPTGDGPPLICVDAGHGGRDPGAIGVSGSKEKDVNLAIASDLAEELRQAGLRVIMTREDDRYPTLQERADIANAAQASAFVSIHNNAHANGEVQGTTTFYWGTADEYSKEGKRLAEAIQRNLVEAIDSVDLTARTHWYDLVVLSQTHMVAALVEVGFMTNAAEEAKLLKSSYRSAAADGIAAGVMEYLGWSATVYTSE